MGARRWSGSDGRLPGFFARSVATHSQRKLVRLTCPSLSKENHRVNILDDINHSIQKYC